MYFMSLRPAAPALGQETEAWPSPFLPPGWASPASPPLVCNPVFLKCQAWDRSRCSWDPELCCGCRVGRGPAVSHSHSDGRCPGCWQPSSPAAGAVESLCPGLDPCHGDLRGHWTCHGRSCLCSPQGSSTPQVMAGASRAGSLGPVKHTLSAVSAALSAQGAGV